MCLIRKLFGSREGLGLPSMFVGYVGYFAWGVIELHKIDQMIDETMPDEKIGKKTK